METIIANLADPSWWFTGFFFTVAAILIKPVGLLMFRLLNSFSKGIKLKRLEQLRDYRSNHAAITYQIVRSHAYFVAFLLVCLLYLIWFTASPLKDITQKDPLASAVLSLPIYVIETMWLLRDAFSRRLVKEHKKLLKYRRPLYDRCRSV